MQNFQSMTELLAQIYIHTESHTHFFYLFIYFFVDCFLNNFFSLWVFRQALFCEPDTFFSFSIVADVGACTVSFRLESNDFWFFHHIVYITLFLFIRLRCVNCTTLFISRCRRSSFVPESNAIFSLPPSSDLFPTHLPLET